MLYVYVGVISLLQCLICIIKPWFALVLIIYLYKISWIRCHSLCVIFYFQEIMWERWVYRNLWENGGQTRIKEELQNHASMSKEVQLEFLDRLSWLEASNKERNQKAEFEKEKSNLSTDQYFGCISLLKNPIDTKLAGLELWLKYLQLSIFEFF